MTDIILKSSTVTIQTAENGYVVSSQGKRKVFSGATAGADAQAYSNTLQTADEPIVSAPQE